MYSQLRRLLQLAESICFVSVFSFASLQAQEIYWTDTGTHQVQRANLDGSNIQTILQSQILGPASIALDRKGGKIYWADQDLGAIKRANLNGSQVETLVQNLREPQGIALDLASGKVYWTDFSNYESRVYRANLNGSNPELLIQGHAPDYAFSESGFPGGIALDLVHGKMYWAERLRYVADADGGALRRANLDGSGAQTIYADLAGTMGGGSADAPRALALDVNGGKIYWTSQPNYTNDEVKRCNLDGSQVETIFSSTEFGFVFGEIALDHNAGKIYWAEESFESGRIRRANLDGSAVENFENIMNPMGLALDLASSKLYWSSPRQTEIRHANLDTTNSQVLLTADSVLTPHGITFEPQNKKIYLTDSQARKVFRANHNGSSLETIYTHTGSGQSSLRGIAIDLTVDQVYWSNKSANTIQRANLNGTGLQTVLSFSNIFYPDGIALDYEAGKIYLAQAGWISKANLDGSNLQTVTQDLGSEKGIALDKAGEKVYWTNNGYIYRSNLDGSAKETLLNASAANFARDLALDPAGKIYWTASALFSGSGQIRRSNLDGSNVEIVIDGLHSPQGIALNVAPQILTSFPPNNAIDARQPSLISGKQPTGISIIVTHFSNYALQLVPEDFLVTEEGGDGVAPLVEIYYITTKELWLYLSEPIETAAWTTIHYLPTQQQIRLGYLPGDVNGDGTSSPVDILALIDSLNNVATRPIYSTDINRSAEAEPSDILREIDLLNGADAFEIWNGVSLP